MEELHKTALEVVNKPEKRDIADVITSAISTKQFITIMTLVIIVWIVFNIIGGILRFDLYPFIFLNLMLGMMSAFTGPFVMMSQAKTEEKDRKLAEYDIEINRAAEEKIEEVLAVLHSNLEHSEQTRHDIELIYESLRNVQTELGTITHPKRTRHV